MYREVEEVAETVNMMIENGVVGDAIVETDEYTIKIKLIKSRRKNFTVMQIGYTTNTKSMEEPCKK